MRDEKNETIPALIFFGVLLVGTYVVLMWRAELGVDQSIFIVNQSSTKSIRKKSDLRICPALDLLRAKEETNGYLSFKGEYL